VLDFRKRQSSWTACARRSTLDARRYRPNTVGRFVEWNRRFILFHNLRHPETMGRTEVEAFLDHLAELRYGAELQAQARQAVAFLYREVLGCVLPWPEIARVRSPAPPTPLPEGARGEVREQPKLLDRARAVLRTRRYSLRTEECYVEWMRRCSLFQHKCHPL
jgi:Phage integrase, N-terminal SAM-like domain